MFSSKQHKHFNSPLKIVLFGPESTGKTILAEKLAAHFNTIWNPEFVRGYLEILMEISPEKSMNELLTEYDLQPIALGQLATEKSSFSNAGRVVFYDTNLLEHKIYSENIYNTSASWIDQALETWEYDQYFLMDIDIPWEEDPQRESPESRATMFKTMKNELEKRDIPYTLISGDLQQRFEKIAAEVKKMMEG